MFKKKGASRPKIVMGQVERNAKDKKPYFNACGWVYYRSILALAPNIKGIFNSLNMMNKKKTT